VAKGVAGPVYDCFHRLSVHTLALVDRKVIKSPASIS